MMHRVYLAAAPAGHALFRLGLPLVACLLGSCIAERSPGLVVVQGERRIMAVPWKITVYARDHEAGAAAVAAALAEVERLEKVLSDYDPESELTRLSAQAPMPEPVAVSDDLWRVLVAAERLREESGGAFDIAVGPLTTLWRQARRSGRLPRADKLATARAATGAGAVELVAERQAVRLPRAGSRLDPGGIGRGYAADRALEILAGHGIEAALIDSSGDILVSGPPPGRESWRIAIAPLRPGEPAESLELVQAAVATSGDAYQAVEIDGVRYSHIVDPRTGKGVAGPAAVTVIAPDATAADALATAASVLGPAAAKDFLGRFPGVAARFAWREEEVTRVSVTPGWPNAAGAANCP
jgi:thiamine biosynthesis lipoprotein